ARLPALALVEQPLVAGCLAQAEQAGEQHGGAALNTELGNGVGVSAPQLARELIVAATLAAIELHLERLLDAFRQIWSDSGLGPPQHERPDERTDQRAIGGGKRPVLEGRLATKTRVQEVEQCPQLIEMILDGCTGERDSVLALQPADELRASCARVLDGLCLV